MGNETILIVDDNPDIVHFLWEAVLQPAGYNMLQASDGVSGLEIALLRQPDLVMLDMGLPRLHGLQVLDALRKAGSQVPVIFMTVFGSETIAVNVFRMGVRDYLSKPFTAQQAEEAISRALVETRLARESEVLERNLVAAETVRETVATLSHYINNSLMTLGGSLTLLQEQLQSNGQIEEPEVRRYLDESLASAARIQKVLEVLERVTDVQRQRYSAAENIVDIETELQRVMGKINP